MKSWAKNKYRQPTKGKKKKGLGLTIEQRINQIKKIASKPMEKW